LTAVDVLDDDVVWVTVDEHATRRWNEHTLRVLGVVEPDAVLVVQRSSRTAAV